MLLKKSILKENQLIQISGSKSISNRLLVLKHLYGNCEITNISDCEDTKLIQKAFNQESEIINVHHAGTAMRFLTSFFAIQDGKNTIITGSPRLRKRPIKPLVEALKNLGADIEYLEDKGFPPLKIKGRIITKDYVEVHASISSQFITSLMLIGAKLEKGLKINLQGKITSRPYIEMTVQILKEIGINVTFEENLIEIAPFHSFSENSIISHEVESDWSSASYFYSFAAISRKKIRLKTFKQISWQGDSVVAKIYEDYFGIKTVFLQNEIELIPIENFEYPKIIELDLNNCPDIAQTICVTASVIKISFIFTGLETLKIKETDRLQALQSELKKIGCETSITDSSILSKNFGKVQEMVTIETYEDHRMAMAFAPFCLVEDIEIKNENVVKKSYPTFWDDVNKIIVKE